MTHFRVYCLSLTRFVCRDFALNSLFGGIAGEPVAAAECVEPAQPAQQNTAGAHQEGTAAVGRPPQNGAQLLPGGLQRLQPRLLRHGLHEDETRARQAHVSEQQESLGDGGERVRAHGRRQELRDR